MTSVGIWLGSSWSTETSIDTAVCFPLLMKKTNGNGGGGDGGGVGE